MRIFYKFAYETTTKQADGQMLAAGDAEGDAGIDSVCVASRIFRIYKTNVKCLFSEN